MIPDTKPNGLRFDREQVKNALLKETEFIKNLLSILPIPTSALQGQDDEDEQAPKPPTTNLNGIHGKTRAQSLTELQDRLKTVQSKKKLNYRDKLEKKGLKNRLKKKTKREERNQNQKLVRMQKMMNGVQVKSEPQTEDEKLVKTTKPVFNRDGKMVFSKFDFSGLGNKNERKTEKDPKKILKNLEKHKSKLAELEAKGEKEKATELKEKQAWKNALAKSGGEKVKDDPYLLKKSIKKREQVRKSSTKKWEVRKDGVKKAQDTRQAKRQENLDKRRKDKKVKTMKKAVKRGRIIPGF